ncbi:hypothetical protein Saro_3936 (plasmid) [Novosphingobium aromaticivorans DSM 12444]|uniref:Uncharacterized protein n=2 Tax=Novosphingobium aromaticivorans TaxID=48935 RepID=A4XE17_NOVAD|nr:unknown [Novosphingobium aromaticivorans]ABP64178.1 hypothetical protein Saro_3936 [Novosphingobium aromaticivorans DSM 12444]
MYAKLAKATDTPDPDVGNGLMSWPFVLNPSGAPLVQGFSRRKGHLNASHLRSA